MNRDQMIAVRVNAKEKQLLVTIARHDRRRPSETLRELIRAEAKRRGIWPPPPNPEAS